ncbi:MAG: MBL fold metallo-hydrolase [Paludibacteraceae bacterium]|nr:MBL fold metallo-hydrolase [Paludibacteraceae bacterium]
MQIKTFTFNPIQENTYVVYDETKECIIIDAGCMFPKEEMLLIDFIEDNDLELKRVINTHLHFDHVFGNAFLADRYGVLPEAHKADEFLIQAMENQPKSFGVPVDIKVQHLKGYLNEGDTIRFGNSELKVINTPGHSPGGICFYSEKDNALFVGDSLFRESIGRTDLIQGDFEALVGGISKKLLILPDDTIVYPGHGDTTTIGHEKKFNPYL